VRVAASAPDVEMASALLSAAAEAKTLTQTCDYRLYTGLSSGDATSR
jgi:hypothetical protein